MNLTKECLFNMSIQSSINTLVGSLGAIKRSHDFGIRQKAMQELEQQKTSMRQQQLDVRALEAQNQKYKLFTQRKVALAQIKKEKENETKAL